MSVPAIIKCRDGHLYNGEVTTQVTGGQIKVTPSPLCPGHEGKKCGKAMFGWSIDYDQMEENAKAARRAVRPR
jgi:hypothetical protein